MALYLQKDVLYFGFVISNASFLSLFISSPYLIQLVWKENPIQQRYDILVVERFIEILYFSDIPLIICTCPLISPPKWRHSRRRRELKCSRQLYSRPNLVWVCSRYYRESSFQLKIEYFSCLFPRLLQTWYKVLNE